MDKEVVLRNLTAIRSRLAPVEGVDVDVDELFDVDWDALLKDLDGAIAELKK